MTADDFAYSQASDPEFTGDAAREGVEPDPAVMAIAERINEEYRPLWEALAAAKEGSTFLVFWTTAPVAYDGFGTRRTGVAYQDRAFTWHQVEVEPDALQWQLNRYGSGLKGSWSHEDFKREVQG